MLVGARQHRRARAAGEPRLDLAALGRAAGEVEDDLARGDAEHDLVVARALDAARDRDDLRARRGLRADLRVLRAAHLEHDRDVHQRLDVVDQRRALVEALDRRERRLQARVAALALQRVQQRGLLAADVGAGAAVHDEVERVVGAEDLLADVALLAGLGERGVEHVGLVGVLAADEDERLVGADRVGADDDPLDQLVRVLLHQLAVLERARLGLVGVAHEVLVHRPLGDEGHLLAHREAGAAAAAHVGGEHLLQHLLRLHLQRLAQHLVAAALLVALQRVEARLVQVLVEDLLRVRPRFQRLGGRLALASCLASSTARPASTSSTIVRQSLGLQRADVLAVDRRHRRDVARAQALERAHVEARVVAGGGEHRVVDRVGAAQRARDVRAHVDLVLARRAPCRTCRRRSRRPSGTRA